MENFSKNSNLAKPLEMAISPAENLDWNIYKITSPSGRVYIGITSNLVKRFSVYKSNATSRQTLIFNSIRKYGYENHKVEIIDTFTGDNMYANGKEMFWIRSFMSNKNKYPEQNGLNLTHGGDGTLGYKATPEMREKNRQRKLGKKYSAETQEKKRQKMLGRKMNFTHLTPEFKQMLSERGKKQRHTEDAKRRIGEAAMGNKHSLGRKMTPEQIEHRSSLIRGTKIAKHIVERRVNKFIQNHGTKVIQMSLDGKIINEFPSVSIAATTLGIPRLGIFRVLSGECYQSRGFIFKHK